MPGSTVDVIGKNYIMVVFCRRVIDQIQLVLQLSFFKSRMRTPQCRAKFSNYAKHLQAVLVTANLCNLKYYIRKTPPCVLP